MTIRARLTTGIFLGTFLPFLAAVWAIAFFGQRSLVDFISIRSKNVTTELVRQVEYRHERYLGTLELLAQSQLMQESLTALRSTKGATTNEAARSSRSELDEIFPTIAKTNGFEDMVLLDGKGTVLYGTDKESKDLIGQQPKDGQLYSVFRSAGTVGENSFLIEDVEAGDGHFSLFLTYPFRNDRELQGVFLIHIPFSEFQNIFDSLHSLGNSAEAFAVIDEQTNARIITNVRIPFDSNLRLLAYNSNTGQAGQRAALGDSGTGFVNDYLNKQALSSWAYIPKLKIGIVSIIETDEALAALTSLKWPLISIGASIVILLGVLISYIVRRYISKPIAHLSDVALKLANGDTYPDIDPKLMSSHDHIGQLAIALHTLRRNLRHGVSAQHNVSKENPKPIPSDHNHGADPS